MKFFIMVVKMGKFIFNFLLFYFLYLVTIYYLYFYFFFYVFFFSVLLYAIHCRILFSFVHPASLSLFA